MLLVVAARKTFALEDTKLQTWFERDRAHVDLQDRETDRTLIEFWDEDVEQLLEDGFLDRKDLHGSLFNYAVHLGAVKSRQKSRSHATRPAHARKKSPAQLDRDISKALGHHAHAKKQAIPYTPSTRMAHARIIHQEPTGRPVFAAHERDHHITTAGRRALKREQFALPPGPEEKRRGIKGQLPIDTLKRARNALARAKQMRLRGDITARQLTAIQHRVNRAFPEIHVSPIED